MSKSELHAIVEGGYDLADSTRKSYLRDLDTWVEFAGADPKNWTTQRAQDFYIWLLERLQPRSADNVFAALAYASRWRSRNLQRPDLDFAVVRKARSQREDDKIRRSLSEATAKQLLESCAGPHPLCLRDTALIVVALETGMRRMSLRSMTFEHIVRDDPRFGYPYARVLMKGRDNTRVAVPLSDTALVAIDRWQAWLERKRGPVFMSLTKSVTGLKTNWTPSKTPLAESAINKIVAGRGIEIGVELYPHVFRHTFITWRLSMGALPHDIAAITGHSLAKLGELGGYVDMRAIGERVRNTTPQWLKEMFA